MPMNMGCLCGMRLESCHLDGVICGMQIMDLTELAV